MHSGMQYRLSDWRHVTEERAFVAAVRVGSVRVLPVAVAAAFCVGERAVGLST
jgi:hypothetical protein